MALCRFALFAAWLVVGASCAMFSASTSKGPNEAPELLPAKAGLAGLSVHVREPVLRGPDADHARELGDQLRQATADALARAGLTVLSEPPAPRDSPGGPATVSLTLVVEYCYVDVVRLETLIVVSRDGTEIGRRTLPAAEKTRPRYRADAAVSTANYVSQLDALATSGATAPAVVEASASPSSGSRVVAILDIQDPDRGVNAKTRGRLNEYLTAQVIQELGWKSVPRAQIRDQIQTEKAASYSACVDDACQIELGKALAAESVLATKLLRIGDDCTLVATIYDLRTEAAEAASTVRGACTADALVRNIDKLAGQLAAATRKGNSK